MSINEKLSTYYLFIAIAIRPVYKYCEHMFNFPRINFTLIFILIFILIICINLYSLNIDLINDNFISFLLLIMVSLIQIISFPWILNYSANSEHVYLTTISRTIIQYWLYWFVGIHIFKIFENKLFWKCMYFAWFLTAFIIIANALSNIIFALILDGKNIYIMLGDSFAVLSLFVLCKTKKIKFQTLIIIVSSICLFALWSRASLYCFLLVSLYLLFKRSKKILIGSTLVMLSLMTIYVEEDLQTYRMTRILFGTYDMSNSMRDEQLELGLQDLSESWILGRFMGDVDKNFGYQGDYIHNYLSFWRQFGLLPFIMFCYLSIYNFYRIFQTYHSSSKKNDISIFLFFFTSFCLLEIILARSFVFTYIWLSISGINSYFSYLKKVSS